MSVTLPLRMLSAEPGDDRPITLHDGIRLRVPLGYVVEPDRLWGELAMEALLDEYAAAAEAELGAPAIVARWTRPRRWVSFGAGFGFALVGPDAAAGQVDLLEEIVRLSEHISTARPSNGPHPFHRALLTLRATLADLERPLAGEVLLDAVRRLMSCGGTLLVELDGPPGRGMERLGPVFCLPEGSGRFTNSIATMRAAARAAGAVEPESRAIEDALAGLSVLQAEIVARLVEVGCCAGGRTPKLLDLVSTARRLVGAAVAGGDE